MSWLSSHGASPTWLCFVLTALLFTACASARPATSPPTVILSGNNPKHQTLAPSVTPFPSSTSAPAATRTTLPTPSPLAPTPAPPDPGQPPTSSSPQPFAELSLSYWQLVNAVAWSPDGSLLAAGVGEAVAIYRYPGLEELSQIPLGAFQTALAFSPSGTRLAAGGRDGVVRLWALDDGFVQEGVAQDDADQPAGPRLTLTLTAHKKGLNDLVFFPDGDLLATAGNDAMARLWDLESGKEMIQMIGGTFAVSSLALGPQATWLAMVNGPDVRLREPCEARILGGVRAESSLFSLALGPNGDWLSAGDQAGKIWVWKIVQEPHTGAIRAETQAPLVLADRKPSLVWRMAVSPDGSHLAACYADGTLALWEMPAGRPIDSWQAHAGPCSGLAFHPSGDFLATGGLDASLRLWAVEELASR